MGENDVDELAREMKAAAAKAIANYRPRAQRDDEPFMPYPAEAGLYFSAQTIQRILTDRDALKARVEELRLQLDLLADAADDLAHTTNCSMIDERIKTARAVLTPKEN